MNRRFDGAGIQDHEKVTAFLLYYGVLGIQTADTIQRKS